MTIQNKMTIHTLDLDFLGLEHAVAAFVIEGAGGLALIETGPASTLPQLKAALKVNGWQLADFQQVFLTHIHFDHAGAAWALAEKGATIYVHPKGLPHLAAPERLYNSARMIYGDDMDRLWGPMHPIPASQLYAPEHGESIEAAGLHFTAWYTPGHAVHHIAWQVDDLSNNDSVLFTGDVAGVKIGTGPVVPPCPPPDIHVEDWQASLQLIRELPVERLFLTHFGEIFEKNAHLDELEARLLANANWIKEFAVKKVSAEEVIPKFKEYVNSELIAARVDTADLRRYEAANPASMSVNGLMRYWLKVRGI